MIIESVINTEHGRQVTISGAPRDVDRITALMQAVGPDIDIEKLKRLISEYGAWAQVSPEPDKQLEFVTADGVGVKLTPCKGA